MSDFNSAMGQFQLELVRWNRQINLVSRQDTLKQIALLIEQCRDAWRVLAGTELAAWDERGPILYCDLGSGGGLPGFVWHQLLGARFSQLESVLVEPREKRAWFLERLRALEPSYPLTVSNGRWGRDPVDVARPLGQVLISLKALRLSDPVVLAGLVAAARGACGARAGRLVIARFYPPNQKWNPQLAEALAPLANPVEIGGWFFRPQGCRVLPPAAAGERPTALVVSSYEFELGG